MPNRTEAGTASSLIELDQAQIDCIVGVVPGGAGNVQDIYPLSPLQEGFLFHHLLDEHDSTYLLSGLFELRSHAYLHAWVEGLQKAIDRHDILRTAIVWEGLPRAVQVVLRQAPLKVAALVLDAVRDPIEQLKDRLVSEHQRLDLRQAPLLRLWVAKDPGSDRWYALLQRHHIIFDHQSLNIFFAESIACAQGREQSLQVPRSYRDYVAQALSGDNDREAEAFFRRKLADVTEPTAPFGLLDVSGDGTPLAEAHETLDPELALRVRTQARLYGISAARLFHAAWALVIAHTSGRDDVVCGTVVSSAPRGLQPMLGLFVSTLPLRLELRDLTVEALVKRVDTELRELLAHRKVSPALAQHCSGVVNTSPLFTSVLNYRHSSGHSVLDANVVDAAEAGLRVIAQQYRTHYPLTLRVDDLGESFVLTSQTDRRVDAQRIVGYLRTALDSLVEALEQTPQRPALTLPILGADELHQLLHQFNAVYRSAPDARLVHELFEEHAARTPSAIAVVYEERSLTYLELNRMANQLARYLREAGVGPDRLVAICTERGLEMIVAILGVLKAGGAYMPLDAAYPSDRLRYMLNDAAPILLLTQRRLAARCAETGCRMLFLDADWDQIAGQPDGNLQRHALTGKNLAYVIYTSGSTGRPKGVMIEHDSVVNLWHGLETVYRSGGCRLKRVGWNASFNFDASVQQFAHLLSGRTIVLLPEEVRRDIPVLMQTIEDQAIDGIDCTPSQLKLWLGAGFLKDPSSSLRMVQVGGEAIDPQLWDDMRGCAHIDFFNVYGPTECTVECTFAHVNASPGAPTIGWPMNNRRLYVLDVRGQPVPIGVEGEIYVGGVGNARGYLNQPQLTAERFIADTFSDDGHARLYKTGDIGRWRPDGTLDCLGRNDGQVKIRGCRIELGEVEAQLTRNEWVRDAVALVREDVSQEKRLVAYVTPRGMKVPTTKELREYLREMLPDPMIPSAIVVMDALPMTANGKLDRQALPMPEWGSAAGEQYEEPQGELECELAEIWRVVLRVERIGRHDNFFELGGHSLLMMQLVTSVAQRLAIKVRVATVLENPEFQQFASVVSKLIPPLEAGASGEQVDKEIIVI